MADDCSTAKFACVRNDAYYFYGPPSATDDECDIEEDTFQASQTSVKLLRCYDNKFLILSHNGRFEKQNLTAQGQKCPDNKFCLQFYNNTSQGSRKGRPVMLYTVKTGKKLVACCNGSDGIYPEEMEIKDIIEDSKHKALFYMIRQEASNKYMFESSLYENKYLGLDPDKSNPCMVKLVLRMYNPDNQNDELSPQ